MQNEIRLIDANALISAIEKGEGISWERYGDNEVCVRKKYIDNSPTIAWCNRTSDGLPLLDLRERQQGDYQKRALVLADELKDKGVINNRMRGTLRRAILAEHERPQGVWIAIKPYNHKTFCSVCRQETWEYEYHNFCPNCGADMQKGGTK